MSDVLSGARAPFTIAAEGRPHHLGIMTTFSGLNLPENILSAITKMGYETPTPIQAQAIPPLLEGRDVVGVAQTGTCKTAAFALPLKIGRAHV